MSSEAAAPASTIREDIFNLPNLLTLFRIALIPIVALFIYFGDPFSCLIAVILFAAAGVTDWFDGYLARKQGLVSLTGQFLDPLADKLLVMASLVMLLPMGRISAWLVIIILARELTITGLRSFAAGENIIISSGQGGKFKTAFQMVGLLGLLFHYTYEVDFLIVQAKINFHRVGVWLIVISVFFSLISAYGYFADFLRGIGAVKSKK